MSGPTDTERLRELDAARTLRTWRVGSHYQMHVYADEQPVATFHRAEDATAAVTVINALPDLLDRLDAAEATRDVLLQAMWDARTALGYDTDGDTGFHSTDYAGIAEQHVADAQRARADHDEATDELDAAEAKVRVCEAALDYTGSEVSCAGFTVDSDGCFAGDLAARVRAALQTTPPALSGEADAGGVHDDQVS